MKRRTTTMMTLLAVVMVTGPEAEPLAAQGRDAEQVGERIARVAERAAATAERAMERAILALEDVHVDFSWDTDPRFRDEARGPRRQEEFRWTGSVGRGGLVEIKGINGRISAAPASGDRVEVVAVKSGRRSDPAEVRIEVVEHAGGVTLCAVYPHRSGEAANECAPGDDGRLGARRSDVRVEWEVRVPAGARFTGRTVNGDVEARGLSEMVELVTVNGDVVIGTDGFATARTVNGSIEARMGGDPRSDVSFETVNGSIELDVPDGMDARVDASWLNGRLETDLPFAVQGRMGRRSAEGTLGAGGHTLRLRTVNGSIRIR